jgi:hypothetical protein
VIFFGFLHQGGVIAATAAVPGLAAAATTAATPVHVVFHRTYMPPRSLLLQPWEHGDSAGVLHGVSMTNVSTWGPGVAPLGRWQRCNATVGKHGKVGRVFPVGRARGLHVTDMAGASAAELRTALSAAGCPPDLTSRACTPLLVAPVTAAAAAEAAWQGVR